MTQLPLPTDEVPLESVDCALCGSSARRVVLAVRDRRYGNPGRFRLVECEDCGLRYVDPRPTRAAIARYYPASYAAYRPRPVATGWRASFAWAWDRYQRLFLGAYPVFHLRERRAEFGDGLRRPRVLDVGCGSGSKLAYLGRAGWETFGVDFSEQAIRAALQSGVDHGAVSDGDRIPHPADFFDAVMSWHSLEHHYDPRGTLQELYRTLVPGGLGIIAVPTGDNLGLRLFGERWGPLEAPRHLYHFTEVTLGRMLREVGFEDLAFHYDYTYYGLFLDEEICESLENVAADWNLRVRFPRGLSLAARIPLLPLNGLLGRLWRGMNLVVHFRKPAATAPAGDRW